MAVAQTLSFYNDIFAQAPGSSNPTLMMNDNGTVSFGSTGLTAGGQSLLQSFGDCSNFGTTTTLWPELYAPFNTPTSFFNLPSSSSMQSSVPLSEALYTTSEDPTDLLLNMGSDSEFMQQINGLAPVMHPKLVKTLMNMVAPGPGSPRQTSSLTLSSHSFFDHQAAAHQLPLQSTDTLGSSLFTHCQPPADHQLGLIVDAAVDSQTQAISPICSQPVKAEKSETEDNIEAAVVPVDLIQNRRPFRCQHEGCNKTFKNPQTMKMHHKTHFTDGSAASKAGLLATLPTLSSSLKAGHNKKIPSRCPKCKKTFVGLYELRRHYGRKHSEGEKPFGCRKCGKKFYIEVDVRDHEKLCGEPIQCKCGLKFAFKCNLVAHKKAHPACQDQTSSASTSASTSTASSTDQSSSSSSDSDQSTTRGSPSSPAQGRSSRGTRRQREEIISPLHNSSLHAPLPDFKDIPEAPHFKCARYDFAGLQFSTEGSTTWASNMHYPAVPTFSNFPLYPAGDQGHQQQHQYQPQHFTFKLQQQQQMQSFEAYNSATEMGIPFCNPSSLQGMVRLN